MSIGAQAGVTVATELGTSLGLRCGDPEVLHDGANVVVHLRPAPVVARVAGLTTLVRPGVEAWLTRDIAVARHLAARGVPATRPLDEPGPFHRDGAVVTLWEHLPHDRDHVPAPAEVAARLADLHVAVRDLPEPAQAPGPVADLTGALDVLERSTTVPGLSRLRAEVARLGDLVAAMPARALHGDPHPGNLLATRHGLAWNDFEDTWRGPLAWDLACLATTSRLDGAAAVDAYPDAYPGAYPGDEYDPDELDVCVALRTLYGVVWRFVLATRFPERRAEADRHLNAWLSAQEGHQ